MKKEIEWLLLESDVSKYQISQATGISQTVLSRYSTGKSSIGNMPMDNVLKLHKYYMEVVKMNFEYQDGKLIVDELIIDPGLPQHIVIRIGADFYMARNMVTQVTEKDLTPYKKTPHKSWYRPTSSYQFWMHGLIPRGGYQVEIGRTATEAEFSEIVTKYRLTENDISDVFTDTLGALYGEKYAKTYSARQIRVDTDVALSLETELREKGIAASNGSPGRVNIRVGE